MKRTNFTTSLLVLVVFTAVSGLKLQNHEGQFGVLETGGSNSVSLTATSNPQLYQTFLRFMSNINSLNNYSGFIRRSLFINYKHQFPELQKLFIQIEVGIRAIKKSLIHNNLLVNQYQRICPKKGTFNQSQISRYLNYTIQKEQIAVAILRRTPQLIGLLNSAHKMYKLAQKYVKIVEKTMQGRFCNLTAQKAVTKVVSALTFVFKNNLLVNNWYYGTTTQAAYISRLKSMFQKFNLTSCPLNKPFVRANQNVCFNCPPNSIYNLGTQNCDSCPPGQMLDLSLNICVGCKGQIFLINHYFICQPCTVESGQLYNPATFHCYTCGLHTFLNATSASCQTINCPPRRPRFDRELLMCQACPRGLVIDTTDPSICVDPAIQLCTTSEPYYIDELGKCAICPEGTIFNNSSNTCETGGVKITTLVTHPSGHANSTRTNGTAKGTITKNAINVSTVTNISKSISIPSKLNSTLTTNNTIT